MRGCPLSEFHYIVHTKCSKVLIQEPYTLAMSHDNPTSSREEGRRGYHYECPVEVQSQQSLSARERCALLREMEAEFQNTRKVVISGLPPESNEEVSIVQCDELG